MTDVIEKGKIKDIAKKSLPDGHPDVVKANIENSIINKGMLGAAAAMGVAAIMSSHSGQAHMPSTTGNFGQAPGVGHAFSQTTTPSKPNVGLQNTARAMHEKAQLLGNPQAGSNTVEGTIFTNPFNNTTMINRYK